MTGNITDQITQALGRKELSAFEPVAYYDSHMDCIRVELRDCSFTEERFNAHVTWLEDNYPSTGRNPTAGIMFKGVKHFFAEAKLPMEGIVHVTSILSELARKYPTLMENEICNLIMQIDFSVNMSEPECELVA